MDPKSTWPVVRFLVEATGYKKTEARALLNDIPKDRHSRLVAEAFAWRNEMRLKASQIFRDVVGTDHLPTLEATAERAKEPSTADYPSMLKRVATPKPPKKQRKSS